MRAARSGLWLRLGSLSCQWLPCRSPCVSWYMPNEVLASLLDVLDAFRQPLTRPGFSNSLAIAVGWIQSYGVHAVTEALVVTGVAELRTRSSPRFLSIAKREVEQLLSRLFSRERPTAFDWRFQCENAQSSPANCLRASVPGDAVSHAQLMRALLARPVTAKYSLVLWSQGGGGVHPVQHRSSDAMSGALAAPRRCSR